MKAEYIEKEKSNPQALIDKYLRTSKKSFNKITRQIIVQISMATDDLQVVSQGILVVLYFIVFKLVHKRL